MPRESAPGRRAARGDSLAAAEARSRPSAQPQNPGHFRPQPRTCAGLAQARGGSEVGDGRCQTGASRKGPFRFPSRTLGGRCVSMVARPRGPFGSARWTARGSYPAYLLPWRLAVARPLCASVPLHLRSPGGKDPPDAPPGTAPPTKTLETRRPTSVYCSLRRFLRGLGAEGDGG